jgi:glycosyltransferase involved in cell wall biosynthesis
MKPLDEYLSICIPVYNGEKKIGLCLEKIFSVIGEKGIPILISDNGSTDHTVDIVAKYQINHENIFLYKNRQNLGLDRNVSSVLSKAKTKYAWLLGDDDFFTQAGFNCVYGACHGNFWLITCNASNRIRGIPSGEYRGGHWLIRFIGSHETYMSVLIFRIDKIKRINVEPFVNSLYLQTLLAYSVVASDDALVFWFQDNFVSSTDAFSVSWKIFDAFGTKLFESLSLFPSFYSKKEKKRYLKQHGKYIFPRGFRSVASYRAQGTLLGKWFFKHQILFIRCFGYFLFFESLFSFILPRCFWRWLKSLRKDRERI